MLLRGLGGIRLVGYSHHRDLFRNQTTRPIPIVEKSEEKSLVVQPLFQTNGAGPLGRAPWWAEVVVFRR